MAHGVYTVNVYGKVIDEYDGQDIIAAAVTVVGILSTNALPHVVRYTCEHAQRLSLHDIVV